MAGGKVNSDEGQRFYRITQAAEADLRDFLSLAQLGEPAPRDMDELILWSGISVFRTEIQARNKARTYPYLGGYIAELLIPERGAIRWQRTLSGRGHHTLWGPPEEILKCVQRVFPVMSR
jgi:hypothetical protein